MVMIPAANTLDEMRGIRHGECCISGTVCGQFAGLVSGIVSLVISHRWQGGMRIVAGTAFACRQEDGKYVALSLTFERCGGRVFVVFVVDSAFTKWHQTLWLEQWVWGGEARTNGPGWGG